MVWEKENIHSLNEDPYDILLQNLPLRALLLILVLEYLIIGILNLNPMIQLQQLALKKNHCF